MPLMLLVILAIGTPLMVHTAAQEKRQLLKHPKTWQGELLLPPGKDKP